MWNPVREILSRYAVQKSFDNFTAYSLDETVAYFSKPTTSGGYGMAADRIRFLVTEYARLLKEKKINPLYYGMRWSDVVDIQNKFDQYVKNDKWIFTFFDGINKGLVNIILFNPEKQKFESWKIIDTERSKEKGFDPLADVRDYLVNIFGDTFMMLLPYALIILVVMIIFNKHGR